MSTSVQPEKKTERKPRQALPARVKCEAVLSVWAERRKPMEVCRALGIKWATLNAWQNHAMAAMISALEPRKAQPQQPSPALGPKLSRLLEKTEQRLSRMNKLEKRLATIQQSAQSATKKP